MKTLSWPARQRLLDSPANAYHRVWTIQHPDAWTQAQVRGYLTGEHPWACMRDESEERAAAQFERAYEWMRRMMSERIHGFSGDLPVWCLARRPNPRQERHGRRLPYVRITALVPRARILPSGYSEWHSVLNDMPLLGEQEWDAWDRGELKVVPEDTWPAVLDLQPRTGEDAKWMEQPDHVQLCVDRIHVGEVVDVRYFPASRGRFGPQVLKVSGKP